MKTNFLGSAYLTSNVTSSFCQRPFVPEFVVWENAEAIFLTGWIHPVRKKGDGYKRQWLLEPSGIDLFSEQEWFSS